MNIQSPTKDYLVGLESTLRYTWNGISPIPVVVVNIKADHPDYDPECIDYEITMYGANGSKVMRLHRIDVLQTITPGMLKNKMVADLIKNQSTIEGFLIGKPQ